MTDQFYGEESIKIKQTAKTGWVQSEFRKQENTVEIIMVQFFLKSC